jgi:hypothetical protein
MLYMFHSMSMNSNLNKTYNQNHVWKTHTYKSYFSFGLSKELIEKSYYEVLT